LTQSPSAPGGLHAHRLRRVSTDVGFGARFDRPGLQDALAYARSGDVLVVWRLDRLGRSLVDLVSLVNTLRDRSIGMNSPAT